MALRLNPYIVLNGTTREAVAFYEQALNAEVKGITTFGDMPFEGMPEEAKELVMHAHLVVGESDLMFSDTFPGQPHKAGNNVTVTVQTDTAEEAERVFAALAEGAMNIEMPLQKTDWSPAYGSLTDKYGIPFQINAKGQA